MPHWDPTINLGNILTIIGFITTLWYAALKLYTRIDRRVAAFENMLRGHAETLVAHAAKMEKQDDLLLRLVGDVQRLIGRMEAKTERT